MAQTYGVRGPSCTLFYLARGFKEANAMLSRREGTIVATLVGFVMLVGGPLLMAIFIMGDVIDLRMEVANPMAHFRVVPILLVWLLGMTGVVLLAAWAAARPESAREAAGSEEKVQEAEAKPGAAVPLLRQHTAV